MSQDLVKTSKFLSLVLRHKPEEIGLVLDGQGWANIDELIEKAGRHGMALTREVIARVVETSDKQRFAIDESGQRIRANQGHSVDVDLGLALAASRRRSCFTARVRNPWRRSAPRASRRGSGSTCTSRRTRTPRSRSAGGTAGPWCCA